MTAALATEWAPGFMEPGARPFENTAETLELVGVQFAPEQLDLCERAARFRPGWHQKMYALAMYAMPDPLTPHSEAFGIPCRTVENGWLQDPVWVPTVIELDGSHWEAMDEDEPNWRRFPSVLGYQHIYSPTTGTLLEGPVARRLWDVWPLEDHDVDLVHGAFKLFIDNEWKPYLDYLEVISNGDSYACDYEGTPESQHDHEFDEHGYMYKCLNGEQWLEHYGQTEIALEIDGEHYHRPFGPVTGLHHLRPVWEHLLASSRAHAHAALLTYTPWDREQVLRTERHYSPWLWSS